MSSDLYKIYEEELLQTLKEINDFIRLIQVNPSHVSSIGSIDEKVKYAEKQLKLMVTEVNGINISEARLKLDLQQKLDRHRRDLKETSEKLQTILSDKENFRDYNLKEQKNDPMNDRLLKNTKVLSDGVENLRYAKQTALEADQMGININMNLQKQTETMQRNVTKLKDTQENLNMANRLVNEMNRRRITNKLVFVLIGLVVVIGVSFILYYQIEDD